MKIIPDCVFCKLDKIYRLIYMVEKFEKRKPVIYPNPTFSKSKKYTL